MPLVNPTSAGGFPKGTPPTVVQVATNLLTATNSAVFSGAPTQNNLLVAMVFSVGLPTATGAWTEQFVSSSGTDYGKIFTKTAGASESATQTPCTGVNGATAMIIWELHSSLHTTPTYLTGTGPNAEFIGSTNSASLLPTLLNGLGLSAVGTVTNSPTNVANAGTVDANLAAGTGARALNAGHCDPSQQAMCGILTTYASSSTNSKTLTVLVIA